MTTADEIKRTALEKLNSIIKGTFVYLVDGRLPLSDFCLTEEQLNDLTDKENMR